MKLDRIIMCSVTALAFVSATAMAAAATTAATRPVPKPGFSLTIYSNANPATFDPRDYVRQQNSSFYYGQSRLVPGYGVVRENWPIDLKKGINSVRFTGVATEIDPTTVSFQSLTAPESATVLEQNYEYDLVSANKLLQKYIDKQVQVTRQTSATGPAETISGDLLSFDNTNLVLRDSAGKVQVLTRGPNIESLQLAKADASLITKPTLLWKIHSTQSGQQLAQVTYQTDDLTWRADYNVTVNADSSAADIGAWVTVLNESGAAYPDAKLKLVAGDVRRIKRPQQQQFYYSQAAARSLSSAESATGFSQKSFFEYHLYTLGRTTSLADNSTKQIALFPPKYNIGVKKTYVYYGVSENLRYTIPASPEQDRNFGLISNKKVDVYLKMQNSKKNGLGIPLPAGKIRVYKRDPADGAREFIGEDVIDHTPKDEQVLIKLGSAFDIVGERRQTAFKANYNGNEMTESFEIKVRNHKKLPVHVIIKENLYRWVNWQITACSDKWTKQDYRTIHIPVDVPVNGEKVVTYTVKYTW